MSYSKILPVLIAAACVAGASNDASAQARGRAVHGGGGGHAAPRGPYGGGVYGGRVYGGGVYGGRVYGGRPVYVAPRIVGYAPYRPYYYGYRPGITVGFFAGFGYPYGYPYYAYPYYGYGYPYYGAYGYGGYYGAAYGGGYPLPPASYVSAQPGVAYGGVRIEGAPREAQVFADGYYVGVVDDFDGPYQHLNLQVGAHQIELRLPNQPPIAFNVNVQPGQTITYHADYRY